MLLVDALPFCMGKIPVQRHALRSRGLQLFHGLGVKPVFDFEQLGVMGRCERIVLAVIQTRQAALASLAAVRRRNVPAQRGTGTQFGIALLILKWELTRKKRPVTRHPYFFVRPSCIRSCKKNKGGKVAQRFWKLARRRKRASPRRSVTDAQCNPLPKKPANCHLCFYGFLAAC